MEEWKQAKEANKSHRYNWKNILNRTLTEYIAEEYGKGKDKTKICSELIYYIQQSRPSLLSEDLINCIKINVGARIAEMNTEKTAFKKGLRELRTYRAVARKFPDGKIFYYGSPALEIKEGKLYEICVKEVFE